jgi:hypothetical protein
MDLIIKNIQRSEMAGGRSTDYQLMTCSHEGFTTKSVSCIRLTGRKNAL